MQVKAYVDKNKCSINDLINYKIELQDANSFGDVNIEQLSKEFSIISGPSQQTSMQWINGSVTNSRIMSWSIAPKKAGRLTIPALTVYVGKKRFKTNQIIIQVIGSNNKPTDINVFITAELDKEKAYLGEQITLTYKIYKKIDISIEPFEVPEFSGFWTEELYRPNQIKFKKVDLNGVRYQVGTLYKVALFPISGSEYVINPLAIKVQTQKKRSRRNKDPFFNPFFDSFFTETETKVLRSPERKIDVKNFPEPRPGSFTGAVGSFKITTSIDRDSTYVNEAITFRVSIVGTGNLGLFTLPKFNFSDQIDQFPPKEDFEKNVFRDALSGTMSWEYILVPRISGKISIPPVAMTYFDPNIEKWKKISSGSTIIPVIKIKGRIFDNSGLSKKEVELLERDINYISTSKPVWTKIGENSLSKIILLYLVSFLLVPVPLVFNSILGNRLNSETARASRNALSNARKKIKNTEVDSPIPASKIIFSYLKDKLQLTSDNLDPIVVEGLLTGVIDETLLNDLINHLKVFDGSYYGQINDNNEADIVGKTIELLEKIERQIK
tara:strand:+ start:901 stop:2559 length:1659 start_codon:yes stop_codon:yes gene_type:complete